MTKTIPVSGDISAEAATAVIDVLLLSIIRAHPRVGQELKNYQRLNAAKKALFGVDSPRGPSTHDDTPELIYMAETYIREHGDPKLGEDYKLEWSDESEENYTPPTTLARAALKACDTSDRTHSIHNEEEKVRNLQQKFCRNIEDWLKMAYGQPSLAESVFHLKLRELADLLEPLGIRIVVPPQVLRDANSPN